VDLLLHEVLVDLGHELVQDLRDGFLAHMVDQAVDDLALWGEDVWNQQFLLPANQQRNQLGEVAGKHWVQLGLLSDKFEKSVQKHVLVILFGFLGLLGTLSVDGGLGRLVLDVCLD